MIAQYRYNSKSGSINAQNSDGLVQKYNSNHSNLSNLLTWSNVNAVPTSYELKLSKSNNVVTAVLSFTSVTVTGADAVHIDGIPREYWPTTSASVYNAVHALSGTTNATALVLIRSTSVSSPGRISIYKDANGTNWTGGNSTSTQGGYILLTWNTI